MISALTACGDHGSDGFVVADSASVRIATSPGVDRAFPATPVRLAALQPPDSALTAMPWGVVADPAAGRIYVADGTSERVVVFDADGRFVRTIGRAGGGPGEFRSPTAVALTPSGELAVWDARRGVISRWSAEGELLDERRAPVSYWGPGFALHEDRVLAVTQSTTGNQRRQTLVETGLEAAGEAVGEAARDTEPTEIFTVTRELVAMNLPGMNMPAPRIFAPDLIWAARHDTVLVLNGPGYRIDARAGGRTVESTRRDIPPIPVTEEVAAAFVQAGPYRGFMRRAGLTADQIVAAVGYEEVRSPVQWLTTGPSGHLWVSRGSGAPVPELVDVLAPDGRYLGTFDAPGLPVAFVSDSTFVALEVTDVGEPLLGLYRLRPDDVAAPSDGTAARLEAGVPPTTDMAEGARSTGPAAARAAWAPQPTHDLQPGDEFRDCPRCPLMVVLPRGRFLMGSPEGEAVNELSERWHHLLIDEKPRVEVEIGYRLAVGKYEVTFAEWDHCVEAGGCSYDPDDEGFGRGDRPVLNVNRVQAREYLAWLSDGSGRTYRLPSESEWEYAARAGTATARPWGDEVGSGMAACEGCGSRWDGRSTAPVGSFPANDFGLHDMMGNLFEWVSDCWHRSLEGVPSDGTPVTESSPYWEDGACTVHIRRGGSWSRPPWEMRAAHRNPINTKLPYGLAGDRSAGFRALVVLDTPAATAAAPPR